MNFGIYKQVTIRLDSDTARGRSIFSDKATRCNTISKLASITMYFLLYFPRYLGTQQSGGGRGDMVQCPRHNPH